MGNDSGSKASGLAMDLLGNLLITNGQLKLSFNIF